MDIEGQAGPSSACSLRFIIDVLSIQLAFSMASCLGQVPSGQSQLGRYSVGFLVQGCLLKTCVRLNGKGPREDRSSSSAS